MPRFLFKLANGEVRPVDLGTGLHLVGRAPDCAVVLADPSLSRHHAQFRVLGEDRVEVEDLGSTNGTRLGKARLDQPTPVPPGEELLLGDVVARWEPSPSKGLVIDATVREGQVTLMAVRVDTLRKLAEAEAPFWADAIQLIQDMSLALVHDQPMETLLDGLLGHLHTRFKATRSAVLLDPPGHGGLALTAYRGPVGAPLRVSQTLLSSVLERHEGLLVKDLNLEQGLREAASLKQQAITSILATPLECEGEVAGLLYFEVQGGGRPFQETDLRLATILAQMGAARLRLKRLQDQALEKRLLERDLQIARQVQERLLPERLPVVPGFELRGENRALRGVSSQVFGAWTSPYGRVFLGVAEVDDQGLGAGLLMAFLQAHLAAWGQTELPAALLAGRLARTIQRHLAAHQAVQGAFAYLDPEEGSLRVTVMGEAVAGIFGPEGRPRAIPPTGPAIRLGETPEFKETVHTLAPGELLCLGSAALLRRFGAPNPWELLGEPLGQEPRAPLKQVARLLLEPPRLRSAETVHREDCTLLLCRREPD